MKTILNGLLIISILTGCGLQNQINEIKNKTNTNTDEIEKIKSRVTILESQRRVDREQLILLSDMFKSSNDSLNNQITIINSQVTTLVNQNSITQNDLTSLQTLVGNMLNSISVLEARLTNIDGTTIVLQNDLSSLNMTVLQLQQLLNQSNGNTQNLVNNLQTNVNSINSALNSVQSNITTLQSSLNTALVQLAVLQGYNNIVSIKDPCGKQGVYDEVFLKLSSGQYLASFSENTNGLNTRFSVLQDGNLRTTDGTMCYFTVSNSGTVISNEHN